MILFYFGHLIIHTTSHYVTFIHNSVISHQRMARSCYCLMKRDQLTSCVRHSLNPPRNAFSVSEVELWGGILSGDFRSSRYYCYYFRPSHFYSVQTEVFSNYEPCAPLVKLFLGVSKGGEYSEMGHVSWDDGKRVPFSGQPTLVDGGAHTARPAS